MSETAPVLDTTLVAKRRPPNPRPLLWCVLLASLIEGSCALRTASVPERAMNLDEIVETGANSLGLDAEAKAKRSAALAALYEESVAIARGAETWRVVVGLALFGAFAFLSIATMRALARAPHAARALALAALLAMPPRVAMGALELAAAQRLRPAVEAAVAASFPAPPSPWAPTPDEMARQARLLGAASVAVPVATCVSMCLLLAWLRMRMRRPEFARQLEPLG